MRPAGPKHTFSSIVVTQAIALALFVVVPVVVTFLVPRTTIEIRRVNGQASAEVTRHTLLFVPVYRTTIEPLLDAEGIVKGAKSIKEDRQRNRPASTQIADGSILLIGKDQQSQVQSTYEQAMSQAEQIKSFIENPAAEPQVITANGPWMLTYVLGGVLTGLTVLYGVGVVLAIGRFLMGQFSGRG